MPDNEEIKTISKISIIVFTAFSFISGALSYCHFSNELVNQLARLGFSIQRRDEFTYYSSPREVAWEYLFICIACSMAAVWSLCLYLTSLGNSPGNSPEYEEYKYPSSEAKDDRTNSL